MEEDLNRRMPVLFPQANQTPVHIIYWSRLMHQLDLLVV